MILVRLIGGLGNQMFQYALGRSLAIRNKTNLKLDITGFEIYKLHKYSLNNFNIIENFSNKKEIENLINKKYGFIQKYFLKQNYDKMNKETKIIENEKKFFNFDASILNLKNNIYLDGYWQTEKYFIDIKDIIKKEFTIKKKLFGKNLEIKNIMDNYDSVSLHIRRGDYVNIKTTNEVHGTCSLDYYFEGAKYISERVKNPHFFIFSDDPEWVKNNLKLPYKMTFVNHNNADTNYEDLRLMSLCKHNIIANSSFSWWGAWLNNNPDKIVIAPKKWFNDPLMNTKDLIPESWIKI